MLDPSGAPPTPDAVPQAAAGPGAALSEEATLAPGLIGGAVPVAARSTAVLAGLLARARPATRADRALLLALLLADVALIAAYLAYAYAEHHGIERSLFHGNVKFSFVDGGYPEIYGYLKQSLAAVLLLGAHAATRQAVYRALALLFAVTMLDDSLALHEAFGTYLATGTGLPIRLTELAAWGAIGLVPVLAVIAGYRGSDAASRADARAVLAAFAILLFFAVGMDVAHGVISRHVAGFQTVLTLAEDGGELFTLTLICAVTLGILRRIKAARVAAAPVTAARTDPP